MSAVCSACAGRSKIEVCTTKREWAPCPYCAPKPDRQFLDTPTVDKMLADVRLVEGDLSATSLADLCCHIKALAADREALHACRKANHETIRRLHDATIVLRNGIRDYQEFPQAVRLEEVIAEATRLIEETQCNA